MKGTTKARIFWASYLLALILGIYAGAFNEI